MSRCLGQVALQGDRASEQLHLGGGGGQHRGTKTSSPLEGKVGFHCGTGYTALGVEAVRFKSPEKHVRNLAGL